MSVNAMLKSMDRVFDDLLQKLGCSDGTDAILISHWQPKEQGFRIQVTRKIDQRSLSRFVDVVENVTV